MLSSILKTQNLFITLIAATVLAACGGGGGGASAPGGPGGGGSGGGGNNPPAVAAQPSLGYEAIKAFVFTWTDSADATHYQLLEAEENGSGFVQIGADIPQGTQEFRHEVPLYTRLNAMYTLRTCNANGCVDSSSIAVTSDLNSSVGYLKASNSGATDTFGEAISLSGDGRTLAIGAEHEDSSPASGDPFDNSQTDSGEVYIYFHDGDSWKEEARLKTSGPVSGEEFGHAVSLNHDGNTLAIGVPKDDGPAGLYDESGAVYVYSRTSGSWTNTAFLEPPGFLGSDPGGDFFGDDVSLNGAGDTVIIGAPGEDSESTFIDLNGSDNSAPNAGAAYVFRLVDGDWVQDAYLKAANAEAGDFFGSHVSISSTGEVVAIGALNEDSAATGIDGDATNNDAQASGAVYIFVPQVLVGGGPSWRQEAYIKASNTGEGDTFGRGLALSDNGGLLAVAAPAESSHATVINGDEQSNAAVNAGAVYLYSRLKLTADAGEWRQQAYVKAPNSELGDRFGGGGVSLSAGGDILVVGSTGEDSGVNGIDGDQANNDAFSAGAAYVFEKIGSDWFAKSYLKASNSDAIDEFGRSVAISGDGSVVAVGSPFESSSATGIGGDQDDNSAPGAGAVYLY